MIDTLCLNLFGLLLICSPGQYRQGYASWYQSDYLMSATVELRQEYRQLPVDLSQWDGFLATMSCDLIGETVLVRLLPNGKARDKPLKWRRYLVSDCSGHLSTTDWMARNSILVEFGARTAKKLGIHGEYGVPIEAVLLYRRNPRLTRAFQRLITFRNQWNARNNGVFSTR